MADDANQPLVRLNAEPEKIAVETAEAQRAQAADTVERGLADACPEGLEPFSQVPKRTLDAVAVPFA
jgi:hypothetical protein